MSLFSLDELRVLVKQSQAPCVSLYMPTVRAGSETQQNPIRFKNLIKQAETQLQEYGLRHTEALDLLQPAVELDQADFWQHQDQGLALFMAKDFLHYSCLPLQFQELVLVNAAFHVKPLLPLLSGDGEYYLLTLSQERVQLWLGSRYRMQPLDVPNLPESMDAALQYDETAKEGQVRSSTSKGGTNNSFQRAGVSHGQGSPDRDDVKQDILQYFHLIDQALHEVLRDQQAPLILAGVNYLHPIYQEANTYPHLLDTGIQENTKLLTPEELHRLTWSIVEPYFTQVQQAAIDHYRELNGTGKTSANLQEAVPASYYGRVEELFVAVGVQQWGSFDPESSQLQMHAEAEPGDQDLLNAAAVQTLLNGGKVYALPPDTVPDAAPLAAIFRY